jgi:integrase
MQQQLLLYEDTVKLPDIFSQADIKKLVDTLKFSKDYLPNIWGDWMRARDTTILMTIYLLALRPKEACCLRFEDFNSETMTVKIRGENNKTKKDRVLPVPIELLNVFQHYFNFNRARFWKGSPYLFPSYESIYLSPERWKHLFREKILKPAGLWVKPIDLGTGNKVPKFRSYTLRHTRATELLNKSNDIFLVANVLGHAKLTSTRVYLHKTDSYVEYMRKNLSKN